MAKPLNFEAQIIYKGITYMKKRDWRRHFLQPMYAAMGRMWMETMHDKHFTTRGGIEYGYEKRSAAYQRKKAKKKGHQRPLVWSGQLEMLSKIHRMKYKYDDAAIVLPQARGANRKNPKSKVNMRRELTTISSSDATQLIRLGNRYLAAALRNYPQKTIIRVK